MNPKNLHYQRGLPRLGMLLALLLLGTASAAMPAVASDRSVCAQTLQIDRQPAATDPAPIRLAWDRVGSPMT